jgi:hypothetical protein
MNIFVAMAVKINTTERINRYPIAFDILTTSNFSIKFAIRTVPITAPIPNTMNVSLVILVN